MLAVREHGVAATAEQAHVVLERNQHAGGRRVRDVIAHGAGLVEDDGVGVRAQRAVPRHARLGVVAAEAVEEKARAAGGGRRVDGAVRCELHQPRGGIHLLQERRRLRRRCGLQQLDGSTGRQLGELS